VNLLGDNIDVMKEDSEILINAFEEVGLEINAERAKCMLISCHQSACQNRDVK
jgi:hypothetical protein